MNKIYATLAFVLISSSAQALPLPAQSIKAYDCDRCIGLSHELLQDKWSLANKPLNFVASNKQKSYGYRQEVTGQQLQTGIPLSFLATGAVIRVGCCVTWM